MSLESWAGEVAGPSELARRYGVSRSTLHDWQRRNAVIGLGGPAHGVPREEGFDITAASQVMATLCMSDGIDDLKLRLGRLIVGTAGAGTRLEAASATATAINVEPIRGE